MNNLIEMFITKVIQAGGWMETDRVYLRNKIYPLLDDVTEEVPNRLTSASPVSEILYLLVARGNSNKDIWEKIRLESQLGDILMPPPSVLNALFAQRFESNPREALAYLKGLSTASRPYLCECLSPELLPAEPSFSPLKVQLPSPYVSEFFPHYQPIGEYQITPECSFCFENEGFQGNEGLVAKMQQRIIHLNLNGESWGFAYSPIEYLPERCFFMSEVHQTNSLDGQTISRLSQLAAIFPAYTIAYGGGIDGHEVYEGWRNDSEIFTHNGPSYRLDLPLFSDCVIELQTSPLTILTVTCQKPESLSLAGYYLIEKWYNYQPNQLKQPKVVLYTQHSESGYRLAIVLLDLQSKVKEFQLYLNEANLVMAVAGTLVIPEKVKDELATKYTDENLNQKDKNKKYYQLYQDLYHQLQVIPEGKNRKTVVKQFITYLES